MGVVVEKSPCLILALLWWWSALLAHLSSGVPLGSQLPGGCHEAFWSDEAGRHSAVGGAVTQPFTWAMGKLGSRARKSESGRSAPRWVLWLEYPPSSWFYRRAKLLVRITPWVMQVRTQSAKVYVLVVASHPLPFSVIVTFPVLEPFKLPCNLCGMRSE